MDARSKDLVNSSSGGSFYKLRLSKAKDVLGRLLSAKREYEDTEVTPALETKKNIATEGKEDLLESRVDRLEKILQSVIQPGQQPSIPVQAYPQAKQVNHHQNLREVWSMNAKRDFEGQGEVHQNLQPYTEPCPTFIHTPSLPTEYPIYQPYHESRNHELYHSACQPDYSSHDLFCPNHPCQICSTETGDCCQIWSNEDLQVQNTPHYLDQTCPSQPPYQPHQQQNFELTSERTRCANPAEEEIEEAAVPQQSVQVS